MPRPFRIDLTDYTCLKKYIASHPERRAEFEDMVVELRACGITTMVIDDKDGSEVYELTSIE